jgi:DNA-binding transcriptional LysR family regulator
MARRSIDLRLLEIALALLEERNVSRVAMRLRMSQPAVSAALARLRREFNDPLFVRTPRGMEATPRAQALIGPAREILLRADRDLFADPKFDPESSEATLTLALSDIGEMVFLPKVLQRLQQVAPLTTVRSVAPAPRELRYGLETGEIDLAVGYFPDLVELVKGKLLSTAAVHASFHMPSSR